MPLVLDGTTGFSGGGGVATSTALGSSALFTNSTGTNLVAIGYQAGYFTTAGPNVFVGSQAGYTNSTGTSNIGIGYQALYSNTTASNNTAVGYQAGYTNTTGSVNVAVGVTALYTNTTGRDIAAVGASALLFNTTGSYNTAFGSSALEANTTASNNTAVGYRAGYAITTQSNNIYIGYSCGSSQTGSGGIFIGANAFSGYNGNNQVAFKTGDGREALYADIGAGASFRQYSNSSSWATVSDQRVKENIVEITNGLDKIVALRPVTFDYITSKEHNAGFIAQDFQNVLPDQVKKVKARPEEAELVGENEIYSIQQNLVPYLVNAIKDLKAIVDAQAAEIVALKAKVGL